MVLHSFHLRFNADAGVQERLRAIAEIRAFQGKVPGLLATYVGENFSTRSNGFHVGAVLHFTDRNALASYASSAIHQHLLEWLVPLVEAQDLDFEV